MSRRWLSPQTRYSDDRFNFGVIGLSGGRRPGKWGSVARESSPDKSGVIGADLNRLRPYDLSIRMEEPPFYSRGADFNT